jgi:hypothetical protein
MNDYSFFIRDYIYLLYRTMILRNLLFFIAILLIIGWILGFLVWKHEGHTIHILAALAVIAFVLGLTRKPEQE